MKWLVQAGPARLPGRCANEYEYLCDRPPREEIIQEFHDSNDELTAVITRNSYGSLVLNARDLMFIDVDLPRLSTSELVGKFFGSLFGRRYSAPDEVVLHRIRDWAVTNPEFTMRLYRTAAGFRAMIVDRPMNALSELAKRILVELESDPLYRRLCDAQECFRARLTPKPWRIEIGNPPARYPFADVDVEAEYRRWLEDYDQKQAAFSTCRFIEQFGNGSTHSDLEPFVKLHDELTLCKSRQPLA